MLLHTLNKLKLKKNIRNNVLFFVFTFLYYKYNNIVLLINFKLMEFKITPWYVINRGWERAIADANWILKTENKEIIEVINYLFKKEEVKEDLVPKKTVWKSQVKK